MVMKSFVGCAVMIALAIVFSGIAGIGAAVGVYAYFAQDLPDAGKIEVVSEDFETTKIYDRTGTHLLYEVFDPRWGDRTYVTIDQIPVHVRNATIALEDANFYDNPGINLRGMTRAFVSNLRGRQIQGGSSITVQLVKNVLIDPEERIKKSYARKIKEAILATEITRRYPGKEGKDKILEWYLNTNFYGNLAYGIEAAAQAYFGKPVQDLTLPEAAMLVPIPQYPALNPFDNPDWAKKRQGIALDEMVEQGYITAEEAEAAKAQELTYIQAQRRFDIDAPHFSIYVRQMLEEMVGPDLLYRGGLRVYTTLDLDMHKKTLEIARKHISELEEEKNVSNAGVIVLNARTGEIMAMLGSLDYNDRSIDGQVNMTTAARQPGSSFKPFTYVTAFAQGYTPATMVLDVRTSFPDPEGPYTPENYDRTYHGPVRLRRALACSYNIPAVKVMNMVGVRAVLNTAHKMGINTLTEDYYGLSLTLGGGEVRLIDMAYAYSVFANQGVMSGLPVPDDRKRPGYRELDPVAILRIDKPNGETIFQYLAPQQKQVLDPKLAYLVSHILSDNASRAPAFGGNSALKISRQAAAKTGTTNNWQDNWTLGFTPQFVVGVWSGNADNTPMEHVSGVTGAAPIWHDVMEMIHDGLPEENFVEPPGLVRVGVDAVSGLLPTEYTPNVVSEIFIEGTEPTQYDNVHQPFRISRESGKLATVYTPPEVVEEKIFTILPPEADDWVREEEIPQPPTEYCDLHGPSAESGDVVITEPKPYSYVRGQVEVRGNAKSGDFELFRLQYGEGLNPNAWIQIGEDRYDQIHNDLLQVWDTRELDGFYTLDLIVRERSQNYKNATIQVTVDNISPTIEVIHPVTEAVYMMEYHEWVSIQADAVDNVKMDKVEFYIDDNLIDFTTVAPYNKRWTIVMSDVIPYGEEVTRTFYMTNGFGIISDTVGYTETHAIHAVGYDAAGNSTESEKVQIYIIHEPPREELEREEPVGWLDEPREFTVASAKRRTEYKRGDYNANV